MKKTKFVPGRNLSFFYLSDMNTSEYKDLIRNYLKGISEEVEKIGEPHVLVDFYDGKPKTRIKPTGHLFIYDIEDRFGKMEKICESVLSKDRKYIPAEVECSDKKDYGIIEKILKDNYGERGRLTNGFLGLSRIFGMRKIKRS